jgi:hypothetical protein
MSFEPLPFAFEFRIFAPSLLDERALLSAAAGPGETRESSEIYIVSRLRIDANVKIRNRRLEVKALTERTGVLEGWARVLASELPISAELFMTEAAVRLGVELDLAKDTPLTGPAILAIADENPGLGHARVDKLRTIFELKPCRAEFAALKIGPHKVDTIAIESSSPDDVRQALERLGLTGRRNESYPCYLQRLVFYPAAALGQA